MRPVILIAALSSGAALSNVKVPTRKQEWHQTFSGLRFSHLSMPRIPDLGCPSHSRVRAAAFTMAIPHLDSSNFTQTVHDGVNKVSVVKFYAPWCRTCAGVAPGFERAAYKTQAENDDVQFYQVNFKENRDLCMQERIVALPTIHLYVPGIGRMSRFTCTAANFAPKFRRALGSLVDSPERLSLLKSLQQEAVAPVIRYQQLMSVLQALSRADEFADSESAEDDRSRTLRNAAAADETFLKELEAVFALLDKNADGKIDGDEIEAALDVMWLAPESADGNHASDEAKRSLAMWDLQQLIASAGSDAISLDLAAFVQLMTSKFVADYKLADKELLPAFRALDLDGDGAITLDELTSAMESVCAAYPDACADSRLLSSAFKAFDFNESGGLDYDEFVTLASRRVSQLQLASDDSP